MDIETDDDKVVISGERFKFKLPSDDPDGFPSIPAFEADDYLVLDGPKFKGGDQTHDLFHRRREHTLRTRRGLS